MAELTAQNVQNMLNQQTMQNNAWSAEQAQKQMDFQEHMSNTAYQRQVADLKAAGLNPALVYGNGGSGAATSAGAMANSDTSGNAALVSFLGNLINTQNELRLQENNAKLQRELTEKNNSLTAMIAELNRQVSLQTSLNAADAQRYAANQSAGAQIYGYDTNAAVQQMIQEHTDSRQTQAEKHDYLIHSVFPTNATQAAAGAVEQLYTNQNKLSYNGGGSYIENKLANRIAKREVEKIIQATKAEKGLGGSSSGSGGGRASVGSKKNRGSWYQQNKAASRSRNYKSQY